MSEPDDAPPDPDIEPQIPPGSGWLQTLSDFDWLHVPGAVRAIARLVRFRQGSRLLWRT